MLEAQETYVLRVGEAAAVHLAERMSELNYVDISMPLELTSRLEC